MKRILALHGFLGQGRDWRPVLHALESRGVKCEALCPDLFAPSTGWLGGEDFNGWVTHFLEQDEVREFLATDRVTLLGYSFGGRLALYLASRAPRLFREVILLSAHPGLLSSEERQARLANDERWAAAVMNEPWSDLLQQWNTQPVFARSREPVRHQGDFDRERLAKALITFSLARMGLSEADLRRLSHARWICGEADVKFSQLYADLHARRVIAKPIVISGASHRVLIDRPEAVAELLVAGWKV